MSKIPTSGSSAYLTVAEFILRKDVRPVGEFVRDDDGRSTAVELESDAALAALLSEASGQVEVACMKGGRYTPDDLAALNGNAREFLKGIVSALAFEKVRNRRGTPDEPLPEYEEAKETLKSLASGETIFPFAETVAAGLPKSVVMRPEDYDRLPLVSNQSRFMGVLNRSYPRNP